MRYLSGEKVTESGGNNTDTRPGQPKAQDPQASLLTKKFN